MKYLTLMFSLFLFILTCPLQGEESSRPLPDFVENIANIFKNDLVMAEWKGGKLLYEQMKASFISGLLQHRVFYGRPDLMKPEKVKKILIASREQTLRKYILKAEAEKRDLFPAEEELSHSWNVLMGAYKGKERQFHDFLWIHQFTPETYKEEMKFQMTLNNFFTLIDKEVKAPSEAQVKEHYETNKDSYIEPRKVKLSFIYMKFPKDDYPTLKEKAKKAILKLRGQVKSGKSTIAKLARNFSDDGSTRKNKGETELMPFDQVPPEFQTLAKLKLNELSPVYESIKGFFFGRKIEDHEERLKELEEVQEDINKHLKNHALVRNRQSHLSQLMKDADVKRPDIADFHIPKEWFPKKLWDKVDQSE